VVFVGQTKYYRRSDEAQLFQCITPIFVGFPASPPFSQREFCKRLIILVVYDISLVILRRRDSPQQDMVTRLQRICLQLIDLQELVIGALSINSIVMERSIDVTKSLSV
jgi:hypothetical protein